MAAGVFAKVETGGAQDSLGKVTAVGNAHGMVSIANGADVLAFLA